MIPIAKPIIDRAARRLVKEVLDSGMLAQGPKVAALEDAWAAACGARHAIATSSGTAALHVALLAHGIGPGDEVITTPFTFMATVNSILFAGATPVFADILPDHFNIDPARIEAAITPRTKAIMPVHLYGHPAQMDRITALGRRHNLIVIEDAAQAIGASFENQPCGGFGTGCFSLYATKNVMSGEGGMITTSDDAIARMCKLLRAHGSERRYYHDVLGYNFRMTDLHAAIGLAQIARLEEFSAARLRNAAYLNANIHNPKVITPLSSGDMRHVWHQYTIRITGMPRDAAVSQLSAAGIGTGVFYPVPAHKQRHVIELGHAPAYSLPEAERACAEVISLPVRPGLRKTDLRAIVAAVNAL